jgi:pimeloyl-ACP methyl ester carboxylesterase
MTQNELPQYVTWRIPVSTPTWEKPKESLYISLLGSQTHFVQGKKYRTRVIEAGSGEPLILIHGVGGSAEAWYRNIMRLAQNFHVCAIDALFHGLTSKEPVGDYNDQTEAQVDHVLDFMDAMGFEKANVEGESMGSHIFFRLAIEHPERVMRAVLNTGHQINFKRKDFEEPWKSAESLGVLTRAAVGNPTRRSVQLRMEWLMATPDRVIDELIDLRMKFYSLPEARGGMQRVGIMGGMPSKRFEEEDCKRIKAETLVFWSQYNPGAGADQCENFASLIPGAKYYCMANASHWPQYEHPEEHDAVVTKFLQTGQV